MRTLVTGATGFIGRHVVRALLSRGHSVTAVALEDEATKTIDWFDSVRFIACDLHREEFQNPEKRFGPADTVVHLAWKGLPNYKGLFHFEENLPANYRFLKALVSAGYERLLVAGTCMEYGLQNGCLSETMETRPTTPYSLAKDALRKFLESLQNEKPFVLQWARLFYMHGEGQNPNSLLSQLDRAIQRGDESFNMSGGEQLRDYLPVTEVAARLVALVEHPELTGPVNICSGTPISVRRLVENHLAERGARIKLNLGHYPYPDYEPMAFWGDRRRLAAILEEP
jgi:nucleoside-diphosphate-sugar epimerase